MVGTTTLVLVEQAAAVNAETRLGESAGRLTTAETAAVDRAISLVFGRF